MRYKRLPALFLTAAVSASASFGLSHAQTNNQYPPSGFEFQGRTLNSAVWLSTLSVTEIKKGMRVGTFLQNVTADEQFSNSGEAVLRSMKVEIQVDCSDGAYVELSEKYFTEEFARGKQISASTPNITTKEWQPKEYLPVGSMMHQIVNSICSQRLSVQIA